MNNYRKFFLIVVTVELLLMVLWLVVFAPAMAKQEEGQYRVDIARALREMKNGKEAEKIDLQQYKTLERITVFRPEEVCREAYCVEEAHGVLYRFVYRHEEERILKKTQRTIKAVMLAVFLGTIILLWYIGKKIVYPFQKLNGMAKELAKGNLSAPVREEKSRYFGQFLWGVDMLRENLEQERKERLALQKEKNTFVLSLSHDIKTPLAAIDLYVKALSENLYKEEEKRRQALEGIGRNTEQIKSYVDEIVHNMREDFLLLEVTCKEFYLMALVKELAVYYEEKLKLLHGKLEIEATENCLLYGDFDRTVEVLQNICENALKYGDGQWIRLSFDDEEDCKLITVENSGSTFSEEELPHIFDSFYRGSNSENVKGSGLGLYICKNLLHKMDGEIFAKIHQDIFSVTIVLKKL